MQPPRTGQSASQTNGQRPDICVCLCTHNGQAVIGECLDSLARQALEPQRYRVLVVDDGSADATAAVVRSWRERNRNIVSRLIRQRQAGLAAARNVGLATSEAPLVAYIDDDAIADPGWLEGLIAAFARFPNAAAVGGPVRVRWISPKPWWWHDDLDEVFNRFRPAGEPTTLEFPALPYGCNFAVRRDVAMRVGGFRTDLGRQNGLLLAGEETELFLRMSEAGYQIAYWPDAFVDHLALPTRVSRRYILKRAWNHGRSLARLAAVHPGICEAFPGPAACLRRMLHDAPKYRFRLAHWKYWLLRFGYHYEARRLAPSSRPGRPSQAEPFLEAARHA